ncbi:MAG TPA: flavodoxin [Azonexus sp.]|nr:flavodoxin [Azonexus sp.]
MNRIGLFFGTETGSTRLVAKKMQKKLGDELCDKALNVNRIATDEMLKYDALILGTPSYGVGEIPGNGVSGCFEPNWAEFFAKMPENPDFSGKRIAFFALGAQERYADRFCSSLLPLVEKFKTWGAEVIGDWSTAGYNFEQSAAVVDGRFLGLIIDQRTQGMLTEERIDSWLAQVVPMLKEKLTP